MARIAVVEDNKHLRDLLRTLLRLKSHDVVTFNDGEEAREALDDSFQLVLSDVQMPRLDGIELCTWLRKRYTKSELPLIMISVLDGEDDILRALEAGANDYLVKPFSSSLIKAKVAHHLRMAEPVAPPSPPQLVIGLPEHGVPDRFPVRFDRYDLLGELGQGSYGVVYEAQRLAEGDRVALKLLDREVGEDRELLSRYFREIGVLSSLDCPSIVRFLGSGYEQGRYFLVMQLLRGRSAWNALREDGPLPPRRVARVGADLCGAIAAMGDRGLVHRDVKPANVVLVESGGGVLVDFGLAKGRGDNQLTDANEFLGTAEFIAPEVIAGACPEDSATDLYALGVTLYELLTDTNPFTADSTVEVLDRVSSGTPAAEVRSLVPSIPRALSELVAQLMRPRRSERLCDPLLAESRLRALAEDARA